MSRIHQRANLSIEYQKPHKWRGDKDAICCVACTEPLKRGDSVFNDGCLTLHEACLAQYGEQLKELGLR